MIPIADTIRSKRTPIVNWIIILFNAFVFILQLNLGEAELRRFMELVGLIPARYTNPEFALHRGLSPNNYWPFLTNMFLHGGWAHFIGNMWTLFIFGDNVEDRMGRLRYAVFYILCGILASITHFYINSGSTIPALGASGAISGVMAAYMFMYPRARIIFLIPLFFVPFFFELTAFVYIGIWFLSQLFSGTFTLMQTQVTGIAFWAHIGGFIGGFILHWFFKSSKNKRR